MSSTNITDPLSWMAYPGLQPSLPYMATLLAFFFFSSFIWNFYILLGYVTRHKVLQEPANVYFCNLALTDFLLSIFILFNFVAQVQGGFLIGNNDETRCGVCNFLGFFFILLVSISVHILAFLSIDRFVLLFRPMKYSAYFNWKRAMVVMILTWLISFIMALCPYFGFGEYRYSSLLQSCQPTWSDSSPTTGIRNIYFAVFVAIEHLFPLTALLVFNIGSYRIIYKSLRSQLHRKLKYSNSMRSLEARKSYASQQKRVLYLFLSLLVVNTINWVPVLLIELVAVIKGLQSIPPEVIVFGWVCYLINPVAHPIIELCFIKDLRHLITCHGDNACYRVICPSFKRSAVHDISPPVMFVPQLRRARTVTAIPLRERPALPACMMVESSNRTITDVASSAVKKRRWSYPWSNIEKRCYAISTKKTFLINGATVYEHNHLENVLTAEEIRDLVTVNTRDTRMHSLHEQVLHERAAKEVLLSITKPSYDISLT